MGGRAIRELEELGTRRGNGNFCSLPEGGTLGAATH